MYAITRSTARAKLAEPWPLKNALAGYWSRRINEERRSLCKLVDGF